MRNSVFWLSTTSWPSSKRRITCESAPVSTAVPASSRCWTPSGTAGRPTRPARTSPLMLCTTPAANPASGNDMANTAVAIKRNIFLFPPNGASRRLARIFSYRATNRNPYLARYPARSWAIGQNGSVILSFGAEGRSRQALRGNRGEQIGPLSGSNGPVPVCLEGTACVVAEGTAKIRIRS